MSAVHQDRALRTPAKAPARLLPPDAPPGGRPPGGRPPGSRAEARKGGGVARRDRLYEIDLLRITAALAVVMYHYTFSGYADLTSICSRPSAP